MLQLTSAISGEDWHTTGPKTSVQQFIKQYVETVDSNGFNTGSGSRFYSNEVVFHNQNNAEYHGGEEMWAWMKLLFGQFRRLKHDILNVWEISNDDETSTLMLQGVRNIWLSGNFTHTPTVSIPMSWVSRIGPADSPEAVNGLQFQEVWLYGDTALLLPHLSKEAVVFQTSNILRGQ